MKAKIIISKKSDAISAIINNNEVVDTVELADNVLIDLDKNGNIVSVEIIDLSDAEWMDAICPLGEIIPEKKKKSAKVTLSL
ncbi:MAG: DUF2283 domain-containing protein [Methanosarcinales archaeon]